MKIAFACGGTAGHINPAIAVADTIISKDPSAEIIFIGNPNRMESQLVPKAGYDFRGVLVEGFHRSFKPKSVIHNFKSVMYLIKAGAKSKKILEDFRPDIVMGTGGYVSGPVVRAAAKMGIKTITHESNTYPGVTTKLLVKDVDKVMLATEDSKKYLPQNKDYLVIGNPVRPDILSITKQEAREKLGIDKEKFCILSYGGSNGAEPINNAVAELISALLPKGETVHIHATGKNGKDNFYKKIEELAVNTSDENLIIQEYIDDMATYLNAADLVICRSGAMALSELQAVGKAAILIPSPYVAENHQYHNAVTMVKRNAAFLIEQKDLSGDKLIKTIEELMQDSGELKNIENNAKNMYKENVAESIYKEIINLI